MAERESKRRGSEREKESEGGEWEREESVPLDGIKFLVLISSSLRKQIISFHMIIVWFWISRIKNYLFIVILKKVLKT